VSLFDQFTKSLFNYFESSHARIYADVCVDEHVENGDRFKNDKQEV